MKKILAVFMMIIMTVLTACGSSGSTTVSSSETKAIGSTWIEESSLNSESEASSDNKADQTEETTSEKESEAASEQNASDEKKSEDSLPMGTMNLSGYENTFLGYGCRLEDWYYADAEALAVQNGCSTEDMAGDLRPLVMNTGNFMIMYAENETGSENINIQYRPNDDSGITYNMKELMDRIGPRIETGLVEAGFSEAHVETIPLDLDGYETFGFYIVGVVNEQSVYQKEWMDFKNGIQTTVCVTSFFEDHTDELVQRFYRLSDI